MANDHNFKVKNGLDVGQGITSNGDVSVTGNLSVSGSISGTIDYSNISNNINPVTGLTHDTVNKELDVTFANGTTQSLDLTQYIDDTNLARITSGTMSGSGIATFTRDDNSTFTVDMSVLLDDTNLSRIVSASWNTGNGVLTLNRNDSSTVAVDLDNRYLTGYTETDTLASVTARGSATSSDIFMGGSGKSSTTLTIEATDTSGAPAMTSRIMMRGYEGRGKGIFFEDTSYSNAEWFAGVPYSGGHSVYQIGFHGSQSEYRANYVFDVDTSGNARVKNNLTVGGTISGNIDYSNITNPPTIDNSVDYINAASFNTSNGVLTLSGVGRAGATVDLDNRYLTSYTETDTLQSVTDRGRDTDNTIRFTGAVTTTSQDLGIEWTGFDKEGTTDYSDSAYIKHLTGVGGFSGSVLEIKSMNDNSDGVNFNVNSNTGVRIKGNPIFHNGYHPNADKWTTPRTNTVTLTGDASGSGSASVDGTGNWTVSVPVVVNNDSHTHDARYVKKAGDTMTGALTLSGATDLNFVANSSEDAGDIVWKYNDGTEKHRIWDGGTGLNYRYNGGSSQRIYHQAYHPEADKWTTARSHTVTLTGQVTGTATQAVDGTGAKTWTINTTIDDNALNDQFVQQLSDASSPDYQTPSSRRVDPNAGNPTSHHYAMMTYGNGGNVTGQLATHFQTGATYNRAYNSSWSAWSRMYDDDYHPISWNEITDKPSIDNSVDYINAASFNTSNGVLTLSGVGRAGASVDLDGRYVHSDYINTGYDWNTFDYGSNEGVIARVESNAANPPATGVYNWSLYQQGDSVRGSQIAVSAYAGGNRMYLRTSNGGSGWNGWDRMFGDNYHPNADKWTTARTNTVTLTGDVTGTGNASVDGSGNWTVSVSTTVANDSHNHTYFEVSGISDLNSIPNVSSTRFRPFVSNYQAANRSGSNYNGGFEIGTRASSYSSQFVFEASGQTTAPRFRNKVGGTWGSWYALWSTADFNISDYDTRTVSDSRYVRKTGDTMSGQLTVNADTVVTGDLKLNGSDSFIWTPPTASGYTGFWDQANARVAMRYENNIGGWGIMGAPQASTALKVHGDLRVTGDTYLGDGNGDATYVNDILRVRATDSGNSEFWFGEATSDTSHYGTKWYWDSAYTHTWKSVNAGTETDVMYLVTNDASYWHWSRHQHAHNKDINYVNQLHFNDNVRFYDDGNDNYLNFKWGDAGAGGIKFRDGNDVIQGYVYGDGNGTTADGAVSFGLLDAGGSWAIRHQNNNGTYFYTDNNTMELRVGRDAVTGNYGTLQTDTTRGGWGGYSINGRVVFMHDHSNGWGIYNDVNNEWMIYGTLNGQVDLRYNNSIKLQTTSTGVSVEGLLTATQKSFTIDHPTKEGHKLRYGSLEGPENGVYVRGRLKDNNVIELPDVWVGLVHEDSITVSLTAIGKSQEIWVEDIMENKVIVGGDNINCFYHVFAERKDVDKLITEFKEVE